MNQGVDEVWFKVGRKEGLVVGDVKLMMNQGVDEVWFKVDR
jgi:hypothetical protein